MATSHHKPEEESLRHGSSGDDPGSHAESASTQTLEPSGPMGGFSADLQGKFSACNPALSKLLGYKAQELVGRNFSDFFVEDERSSEKRSAEKANGNANAGTAGEMASGMRGSSDVGSGKTLVAAAAAPAGYRARLFARTKAGKSILVEFSATLLQDSVAAPTAIIAVVAPLQTRESALVTEQSAAQVPNAPGIISRKIDETQFILASTVMHKFIALVDRVAGHTETVLITGETGTGKELIARTIHQSSQRRSRPWVDINCAALPENLVESELFGYEKGAFSGADSSKPGLFELADKGTLFLDEIGELQTQTQVKLLRVLDGQPFYRLGGHRKIKVDVRIVAATNQDLEAAVREGRFRQDLFHRLSQFQLRVPPLRERPEDIVALGEHFLRLKAPRKSFSPQAISALLSHSWPGNIRELRNLVAKVAMESHAQEIDFSRLSAALTGEPTAQRHTASMPVANLESMEEQMIIKALERTGGHRTMAAEQLGISRRTLSRKLKEYNINFACGESSVPLGFVSTEQQKFFRARVEIPVTVKSARGEEIHVTGVNLSTGGMGLDGLREPLRFAGLLDVSFMLPDSEILFQAKARLMWIGEEGRVGVRFVVIEPALFEELQHWTNRKMKEEGWDFPA